jgi:DNA-binding transcriptional regulator YiaG
MPNEDDMVTVKAEMPVSEASESQTNYALQRRAELSGRHSSARWAPVPEQMQADTIKQIRERRGLSPIPPKPEEYFESE